MAASSFYNGGILFSTFVLCFIAMISLYSFLLLVKTRLVIHGSFGGPYSASLFEPLQKLINAWTADIGGQLYGKHMRVMILFSIVLSQIGFVAAYTIFVVRTPSFSVTIPVKQNTDLPYLLGRLKISRLS